MLQNLEKFRNVSERRRLIFEPFLELICIKFLIFVVENFPRNIEGRNFSRESRIYIGLTLELPNE